MKRKWGGHNKAEIPPEIIAQMGKVPDGQLAKLVNMRASSFGRRRLALGIPACPTKGELEWAEAEKKRRSL